MSFRRTSNPPEPKSWFTGWKNEDGEKLSDKQIQRLMKLTMHLAQPTEENARELRDWATDATAFWGRTFHTKVEFLYNFLSSESSSQVSRKTSLKTRRKQTRKDEIRKRRVRRKEPLRRRFSLFILHNIIDEEISRLRETSCQSRCEKYLTRAVDNVVEKVFQDPSMQTKSRATCVRLQRYGERWSLMKPRECILVPFEYATDK